MESLVSRLEGDARFRRLLHRLSSGGPAVAGGLWGSSVAFFLATLARHAPGPLVAVVPSVDDADRLFEDLCLFADAPPALFPAWETAPGEEPFPSHLQAQRLAVVRRLDPASDQATPGLIVAPVHALLQPVPSTGAVAGGTLELRVGERHRLEALAEWLVDRGLERVAMVEEVGQFSVRGGILDVHALAATSPYRIEFFGDEVESVRTFDIETQRSEAKLESCDIVALPSRQVAQATEEGSRSLAHLLPAESWVALHEPLTIQERAEAAPEQLGEGLVGYDSLYAAWSRLPCLHTYALATAEGKEGASFDVHSTQGFGGGLAGICEELDRLARANDPVAIFCNNVGERERLEELLADADFPHLERLQYREGFLSAGFEFAELGFACVGHHEIFNRYSQRRRPRRRPTAPIESFVELQRGDYVVHVTHGIARYLGMERLNRRGELEDFLALQFAEGVKLYVPATKIELVQKYVGSFRAKPTLSKLGGTRWQARKEAVREAVRDLAQDLLHVQALRERMSGISFPADDELVAEFEHAFLYEETPDQLEAGAQIKSDMEKPRPMDRLLCGDVGYGKTELAMRGAFKAVVAGKQVAVLVPTTVLAQQHYRTFTERFADYPVLVEVLSRFKTRAEQRETLRRAAEGGVDILIGTHRLLSGDVRFRDLGLLIIDEEQRFGVEHKERLKRLRATVDILTMTATPIPRTLHMALLGIRDISALETPPQDRLAIRTRVCRPDARLVRSAILRELGRDGQVFFVHNRVYNIDEVAANLREVVPEARLVVAHGQMNEHELERRMSQFVDGQADILVSTTIIESGLDIPRANTMFVNRADMFGLADLHQLRGRIGRYKHRAYAYFLVPDDRPVTPKALHRLKAIEEFNELGAGFRIALRDLEIRGAGNILGYEQHGHIAAVGYDLYCRLLEASVKELRNEPVHERIDVDVDIDLNPYLPADYVPDDRQRMEIYRKLARAQTHEQLALVGEEMRDRFGAPPEPAARLLARHELRIHLEPYKVTTMARRRGYLLLRYLDEARLRERFAAAPPRLRVIDDRTAHLLLPHGLEAPTAIVDHLRELFGA
ncbi:MAG: transcription-repair coupling factor [Candidatus Brocadiia bacterium]